MAGGSVSAYWHGIPRYPLSEIKRVRFSRVGNESYS